MRPLGAHACGAMQPVVVSHTLLHDVAMGGNAAVVARGTGAAVAGPINTHSFRYRWDWRGSRYRVADDEPRHDLFHAPVGTVVVFSDLLNVGYAIPFWPEGQVESIGEARLLRVPPPQLQASPPHNELPH